MPNDTINIQVAASFFENDLLGEYSLPVVFRIDPATSALVDADVAYTRAPSTSGIKDEEIEFYSVDTTSSGADDWDVKYVVLSGVDSLVDLDVEYLVKTGDVTDYGTEARVDFIAGQKYENKEDYRTTYLIPIRYDTHTNYDIVYSTASLKYLEMDFTTESEFDMLNIEGVNDAWIDAEFGGWVPHTVNTDIMSASITDKNIGYDVRATTSGNIESYMLDAFCCVSRIPFLETNLASAAQLLKGIGSELEIVNNVSINYIVGDSYCVLRDIPFVYFDINLFPIKIFNFIPVEEGYTEASSLISVDVVDDVYSITISGTYFIVDGTPVTSGITYTPIADGYRLYYDSPTDYAEVLDALEVKVHAENDNGDILEKDFYMSYGYKVIYEGQ